jgi:hypothetical protein
VWRDDERGGTLVFDEPVVIHCCVSADIENDDKLSELGRFCRRLGRETNQGEVGLIIADEYIAIRNFEEDEP